MQLINLITSIIRAYRPIKGFNFIVNRSRLYNSYSAIVFCAYMLLDYGLFFRKTNQMLLSHVMIGPFIICLIGAFIVQTKPSMRFAYSIAFLVTAVIYLLILIIILLIRMTNVYKICGIFSNYSFKYKIEDNMKEICSSQINYYYMWMILHSLIIALCSIGIFFDYKAHKFLMNKKMVKRKKHKNH